MKITITITERITKEVELPKYFKDEHKYYMTIGETHVVRVTDRPFNSFYFPSIEQAPIDCVSINSVEPISEAEFKHAFTKVSLEIEKLLN